MSSSAAVVVSVQGTAYAERQGTRYKLEAGSPVEASDSLLTDAGAQLVVRFQDGAQITLGPQSQVDVREFSFDASGQQPPAMSLGLMGGMVRSVSGKVVEQNPEAFKLASPLATIGIRGTTTLHTIAPEGERHVVLVLGDGHTVVITTSDGRSVTIDKANLAVTIQLGDLSPLEPLNLNAQELQTVLEVLHGDILHTTEPSLHIIADTATLVGIGVNAAAGETLTLTPTDFEQLLNQPDLIQLDSNTLFTALNMNGLLVETRGTTGAGEQSAGPTTVEGIVLRGSNGNDTLHGTAGDDRLYGMDGDDTIYGYKGNDYIDSGLGQDTVYGGYGSADILVKPGDMASDNLFCGDEFTLPAGVRGDDDTIRVEAGNGQPGDMLGGEIYGDANTLASGSAGGNDFISVAGAMFGGVISGDAQTIQSAASGGADTVIIHGGISGGLICGDGLSMADGSIAGNDALTVYGEISGGLIYGDALSMSAGSIAGNDTITVYGVMNNGTIYGDAPTMHDNHAGNDVITVGVMQAGTIYGDGMEGNPATSGADVIRLLDFASGTSHLYGDTPGGALGNDRFVFGSNGMQFFTTGAGNNHTIILEDFHAGDVLDLSALLTAAGKSWGTSTGGIQSSFDGDSTVLISIATGMSSAIIIKMTGDADMMSAINSCNNPSNISFSV